MSLQGTFPLNHDTLKIDCSWFECQYQSREKDGKIQIVTKCLIKQSDLDSLTEDDLTTDFKFERIKLVTSSASYILTAKDFELCQKYMGDLFVVPTFQLLLNRILKSAAILQQNAAILSGQASVQKIHEEELNLFAMTLVGFKTSYDVADSIVKHRFKSYQEMNSINQRISSYVRPIFDVHLQKIGQILDFSKLSEKTIIPLTQLGIRSQQKNSSSWLSSWFTSNPSQNDISFYPDINIKEHNDDGFIEVSDNTEVLPQKVIDKQSAVKEIDTKKNTAPIAVNGGVENSTDKKMPESSEKPSIKDPVEIKLETLPSTTTENITTTRTPTPEQSLKEASLQTIENKIQSINLVKSLPITTTESKKAAVKNEDAVKTTPNTLSTKPSPSNKKPK